MRVVEPAERRQRLADSRQLGFRFRSDARRRDQALQLGVSLLTQLR